MIWSFGPFELDDEHFELRRDGRAIALRRKVFDVLHYLVAHNDRLVSKDELLRVVWKGEAVHEGVVPQNIAILRRVLGDSRDAAKVIQTVHGRGYRFVADVKLASPSPLPAAPSPARAAPRSPFVGRDHVMNELRALLHEALAGRGRFAVISGEPGIGKTRTCEELGAEAGELGARVFEGRCHEGEGAPAYWPWVQILRAAAGESDGALVLRRLGESGSELAQLWNVLGTRANEPAHSPLDTAEARFRLFDAVTTFLSRLSQSQPLVLIFDDLHWADEATLHLLSFVAREVRTLPLLVVATTRDLDTRVEPHIRPLLSALMAGTQAQRVYLNGLSAAASRELIEIGLRRQPGEPLLRELHALTEGNPFFLQEVVRLLAAQGTATAAGGEQHWRAELPSRVREVIGMRLSGLDPRAQRVLSIASVIGRDFGVAVLEQVAQVSRAELLSLLDAASNARIVRALDDGVGAGAPVAAGTYRFAHALIRESLYAALTEPERVRLHERVGLALEAVSGVDTDAQLDELAHHFYRAASGGDIERAVRYCVRAADRARGLLAFEQAAAHYQRALEALALRLPIDERRRYDLKRALGAALFRAGEDGNPMLLGAAEIARRLGRPELLAAVVLEMVGWPRLNRRGRTANPALYPLLTEALSVQTDAVPRARLLSALALNCPEQTPLSEQVRLSTEALELARGLGHDEALYDAVLARIRLMQAPEDTPQRAALAAELLQVAERLGRLELGFEAHELHVQPLLMLGKLPEADREIGACAALAERLRLPRCRLQVLRFRLERALGDGRFDEIRALTDEAVRVRGRAQQSPGYMIALFASRTFERALRGDVTWFERHIERMDETADKAIPMRSHVAYVYALFGKLEQARACYGPVLAPAVLDGARDDDWLLTLVMTAEAVAACSDREAAAKLYPRLLPHAALNVAHMDWLVYLGCCAHFLGQLGALLGEHDAAAAHFEQALEMNARLGARPALARSSLAYARFLFERGRGSGPLARAATQRARGLLRDAIELARATGMQGLLREAQALAG